MGMIKVSISNIYFNIFISTCAYLGDTYGEYLIIKMHWIVVVVHALIIVN